MMKRRRNTTTRVKAALSGNDLLARSAKAPGVAEMTKLLENVRKAEEAMRPVKAAMHGQQTVVTTSSSTPVGW